MSAEPEGRPEPVRDSDIWEVARDRVNELLPRSDADGAMLVFALLRAADRITNDLEGVHRPLGWSWAGFRVLFWVWLLGPLEPRELALLTSASRATISSLVNTLERDGFVVRHRGVNGDRRLVSVELAPLARERIAAALEAHNLRASDWVAVLEPEERGTLFALLSRVVDQAIAPRPKPSTA